MMHEQLRDQYAHSALVIPVSNIVETLEYYESKLRFKVTFRWGDPLEYVVGKLRTETQLHFTQLDKADAYATSLYVFVRNVNSVYTKVKKNGVKIVNDIDDRDYGIRDFDIADLNGFRLTFSTSLDRPNT